MIFPPPDEPIFIHRYQLQAAGPLNVRSRRSSLGGVLIRAGGGFGCIQPWPELGDPTLEKCLADLAGPRRWPIVRRALRCAEYDAAGRKFEHSLFEEMEVPRSHATLVRKNPGVLAAAVDAGFGVVKIKTGADLAADAEFLTQSAAGFPELRWRLDFNETLDPETVITWTAGLPAEVRTKIDFLEDPSPYANEIWVRIRNETRLSLAVDREAAPDRTGANVMVVKPAIDEPFFLAEAAIACAQRVVVTSSMDHPLGQAFAAWEAARLSLQFPGLVGVCGLQTHHLFEPSPFSECLGRWQPEFTPAPGNGLGFDDLLEQLSWTAL
ncbi:MAG: hypothetical protein V4733_07825 [Verrucomicrobiota bacterium]